MQTLPPRSYRPALGAAAIFAFAAGYSVWQLVTASRVGGTSALPLAILVAVVNVAVWVPAAVLLVMRDRLGLRALQAAFVTSVVGTFLVLAYGLVLRGPFREGMGIVFILGGLVLAVLVKLAWTPFPWASTEPPAEAPPHETIPGPEGEPHEVL